MYIKKLVEYCLLFAYFLFVAEVTDKPSTNKPELPTPTTPKPKPTTTKTIPKPGNCLVTPFLPIISEDCYNLYKLIQSECIHKL